MTDIGGAGMLVSTTKGHQMPLSSTLATIERLRLELNAIPWWRPIKQQNAARAYKYAMLAAAFEELQGL